MEFVPQNNFHPSRDSEVDSMLQLESQLLHYQTKPQTPFSILNQTLSNLKNDSLRRYNTDINPNQTQITQLNEKPFKPVRRHHRQINSTFDQVLVPQPWFNVDSPLFPTNSPLTQNRQRQNNFHSLSKSFHLSKNVNDQASQNYHFNHSSVSYHKDKPCQTLYGKSQKWKQKLNTFLTEESQNCAQTFATYNYSSEQKARMTLEHLIHRKKHSKISKILKIKAHSFDNALQKQQKLTNQSKNLIEALEKFSNDNMLRKSIDRAVDVLKKRTHNLLYNKSKSKKQFRKTSINNYQMNWISSHKIEVNCVKEEPKKSEREKSRKNSEKCTINEGMKPNMMGKQKSNGVQFKSKVAFKPKRSHLIEKRDDKSIEKQIKPGAKGSQYEDKILRAKQYVRPQYSIRKFEN